MDAMAEVVRAIDELRRAADPSRKPGMARFGINVDRALGVSVPDIRRIAKGLGRNHYLARELWATGVHEAMILATIVGEPGSVTPAEMDAWVVDLDSWDLCDHACGNLWDRTPFVFVKAREWARRHEEFVRRAAFALVAEAAPHRRDLPDSRFERFLPVIRRAANDDRNCVKKAVNWALREIGKRSPDLNRYAIEEAGRLLEINSKTARWIARDALRELRSEAVQSRLEAKAARAT